MDLKANVVIRLKLWSWISWILMGMGCENACMHTYTDWKNASMRILMCFMGRESTTPEYIVSAYGGYDGTSLDGLPAPKNCRSRLRANKDGE
eukprot:1341793-Amorphochlora_amoeboformis.AAC.1